MARASKRDYIVAQATRLFLEQGFKGTSVDAVVNTCAVSKPTVYKHFPDKTLLMSAVMKQWLTDRSVAEITTPDWSTAWQQMAEDWWQPETMSMYRLVIGEGWRFPEAAASFWIQFDQRWQAEVKTWLTRHQPAMTNQCLRAVQAELWQRLLPAERPD